MENIKKVPTRRPPCEAHMVKSDGSRVTVYVNKSFDVVSVSSGR